MRSPTRRWLTLASALALCATQALAGEYEFTDAGQIFGPPVQHFGRGNAWGDLDGDGDYDLITGSHDRGLRAYRQVNPLQFEPIHYAAGLATTVPLYGILILDFDRDGDNDVFLNHVGFSTRVVPTSTRFYRNRGNGTFEDATVEAGVHRFGHGFGLVALDYDKDGWIDVYVVNHDDPNVLYRNDQRGGFIDVTDVAGVDAVGGRRGRTTSATSLDFDRDGWMDLYVGQRDVPDDEHPTGNNHLFRNMGDGTFVDVAEAAGVRGHGRDFVSSAGDVNGDNWTDLYIATFNFGPNGHPETHDPNRLYLNNGDGTFRDASRESRTDYAFGTMGLGLEDHDNDGLLDIYVGTGGPFAQQIEDQIFYWNQTGDRFIDATVVKGLLDDARGHGISMFDFDRDGDLDIFSSMGGHSEGSEREDILYLNSGGPNHWLEVQLVGEDCPLEGLGARVILRSGEREIWRWVCSSAGFDSFEVPHVWYGLGDADTIDRLEILWPCGRTQTVDRPAVDQHLQVEESSASLSVGNPGGQPPRTDSMMSLRAERPVFRTTSSFQLRFESVATATIAVYDLRGRRVRQDPVVPGSDARATWTWDGTDVDGLAVAAGRYFVRATQSGRHVGTTVTLVR
jgi:hypothetical protein